MSAELPPPQIPEQLEDPSLFDRIRDVRTNLGRTGASTLLAMSAALAVVATEEAPAMADAPQATVGMPFKGKWAFNQHVDPPYTDQNSSHPSVHAAYGFNWATDIYPEDGPGTDVKVHGAR